MRNTNEQIRNRYAHHAPDGDAARKHGEVRELLAEVACQLNEILPEGRSKSLALTKLEEARLWANTAVAVGE